MKIKLCCSVLLMTLFFGVLCAAAEQDVFLGSAFGWRKSLEKAAAKGTLTLQSDGGFRLYSPDKLLVRACSSEVPLENSDSAGEEFFLQYEGRANFEEAGKSSRGGMILLNINFSDGTRTRKLLGARFTSNSDWKTRRAKLKVDKKVKSVTVWCDLADVKGSFEIRNFRLTRGGTAAYTDAVETFDKNIYKNVSAETEVTLVSKPANQSMMDSRPVVLNQKKAAPVIVSVQGKGDCDAYFTVFCFYADGTREASRDGLIFSADDSEWSLRRSVFYPSKPVKHLVIRCIIPKGNKKFFFRKMKIENFGIRDNDAKPVKTVSNPQDRLPMWIWSNSGFAPQQTICLRQEFELPDEPVSGVLNFAADDLCKVFINGTPALKQGSFYCEPVDAAKFLKAGKNCIGAEVTNLISSAGFLVYGEVKLKNGKTIRITSGTDWKTGPAQGAKLEYSTPGYNDEVWGNAIIINSVTHDHPWRTRIEVSRFLPRENYLAYQKNNERIAREIPIRLNAIDKILREEKPIGDVTFIRKNNLPLVNISGHGIQLGAPFYNTGRTKPKTHSGFDRISRLNQLGFRIFTKAVYLRTSWKEDGTVDTSADLDVLRHILAAAPDGYLMVYLDLNPPEWFVKKYPQELIGYDSGRKLIYEADALKQPLMRPSMASELWLKLAGDAMSKCVEQIEKSPIGKRVIAYMPTYGVYSEWHYYGMAQDMPDTSEPMLKFFRNYLKEKYKTDAALQKAWKDPSVTLANAPRPTKAQRLLHKNGQPYTSKDDCRVPDFDYSIGLAVNKCQEHFNNCTRIAAKRKVLVGNYSGYFFGMAYPAFGWHTGTPKIMNSDNMDFQMSPFPYGWRYSGQSGMPRAIWESYALHNKVPVMEADTRTHQSGPIAGKTSTCLADSLGQINREFCNAFTRGGTLWYYDSDRAWFDFPEYDNEFCKLLKLWNAGNPDVTRVSEIAVVCDFSSVPFHTASVNPNTYASSLISHPANEMNFVGAPYDAIMIEDLIDGKAPKYKFYMVLNMVYNTPEKEAAIRKLIADGAKFLFIYPPEWLKTPPAGVEYAATHRISRTELRKMIKKAGVHFYCDDLDTMIFACRGFVGAHRKNAGKVTLKLRKNSPDIRQVIPFEKTMRSGNVIEYDHPEFGTALFRIQAQ